MLLIGTYKVQYWFRVVLYLFITLNHNFVGIRCCTRTFSTDRSNCQFKKRKAAKKNEVKVPINASAAYCITFY